MQRLESKKSTALYKKELLFVLFCFCLYFLWAVLKGYNYAPDEKTRHDVTVFLFNNNRLPIGEELITNWGFHYAEYPTTLVHQIGFIFMKITSFFTKKEFVLLVSARMVSVFSASGIVYFTIKMSKLIFESTTRWIFIFAVAFTPQFCFLSSYVNSDMLALFGVSIIIYCWSDAVENNWNYKNSVLLSLGISVCALSYYNSYSWILLSIFVFILTYFYKNKGDYKGFLKFTGIVVGITLLLISYNFIRQYIVYDGDLLGFASIEKYGNLYAVDELKPINRMTAEKSGMSVYQMLAHDNFHWIRLSFKSFIGVFGYLEYFCPNWVYNGYLVFLVLGIALSGVGFCNKVKTKEKIDFNKTVFYISIAICALITLGLSLKYSYSTDYQAQGRYCYPAYLSLMIIVVKGFEWLLNRSKSKTVITAAMCIFLFAINMYVFFFTYLPT